MELSLVRQSFDRRRVENIPAAVSETLDASGVTLAAGTRTAIAVGSRGIAHLAAMVQATVDWVRRAGSEPFIVPAMGSHGGATPEGQAEVLAGYGLGAGRVGAPIRSSLEVVELARGDVEVPVYFDREAFEADATIVINRIKPHTSFHGRYESGLMKMLAIGLGKHAQALAIHQHGVEGLRELMPRVAGRILAEANVVLGLAVVENAYDETLAVEAIPAEAIPDVEPVLLDKARAHMPGLPADDLDILIVDEMGKNISGLGMDPNVIGRLKIAGQPEPADPRIRVIVACDLSAGSHGNAIGMGLADIVTRRLADKINFAATYENVLTSTFLERAKLPLTAATDAEAIEFALRGLGAVDPDSVRLMRIRNTLQLGELWVSPSLAESLGGRPGVTVAATRMPLLDGEGCLSDWPA